MYCISYHITNYVFFFIFFFQSEDDIRYFKVTCFFFSSRRRHTRLQGDWSSDVCSSDLFCAGEHGGGQNGLDQDVTHGVGAKESEDRLQREAVPLAQREDESLVRGGGLELLVERRTEQIGRASCRERV